MGKRIKSFKLSDVRHISVHSVDVIYEDIAQKKEYSGIRKLSTYYLDEQQTDTTKIKCNIMSQKHRAAIEELGNQKEIIVTHCDKGNQWVLLNKCDYLAECARQLEDKDFYEIITDRGENQNKQHKMSIFKRVVGIATEMKKGKFITENVYRRLTRIPKEGFSDRILYIRPKTHKKHTDWAIPYKIPKGRPIIANTNTETTEVSKYVEEQLAPVARKLQRVVRSTEEVVELINEHVFPNEVILFILDVKSLYTNLTTEECIIQVGKIM